MQESKIIGRNMQKKETLSDALEFINQNDLTENDDDLHYAASPQPPPKNRVESF